VNANVETKRIVWIGLTVTSFIRELAFSVYLGERLVHAFASSHVRSCSKREQTPTLGGTTADGLLARKDGPSGEPPAPRYL
jgi:hypothetical protein